MDVEIGDEIGQGCFGKVFKGFFKDHVQVKQIIKQYKYFVQIGWVTGALCCQITSRSNGAEGTHRVLLREAALMEGIRSNTVLVSSLTRTD